MKEELGAMIKKWGDNKLDWGSGKAQDLAKALEPRKTRSDGTSTNLCWA